MAAARSTSPSTVDAEDPATPSGPKRSAKWLRRREEIVDRSASLFAQRGFHATSTNELCEANDLGKGALYYYIGSKEELLAAIHDRVMDDVLAEAEAVVSADGTPAEHLTGLGTALLHTIIRYPHHVWVFLHEFPALTGDNASRFRARRRAYESVVEDVLSAGVASREFRAVDPALTARAWLGMHNYAYLWLRADGDLTAAEIGERYADLFLHGVAA